MKKFLILVLVLLAFVSVSCEKQQQKETPLPEKVYRVPEKITTNIGTGCVQGVFLIEHPYYSTPGQPYFMKLGELELCGKELKITSVFGPSIIVFIEDTQKQYKELLEKVCSMDIVKDKLYEDYCQYLEK